MHWTVSFRVWTLPTAALRLYRLSAGGILDRLRAVDPPLLLAFALDPPPECVDALRFFPPASTPGRSPFLSSAAFATGQPGIPGISPSCAPSGRFIEK